MSHVVSYLLYQDAAENPNEFPGHWIAESVIDPDPVPDAPWITVSASEFATLMAAQKAEYATAKAEEIEDKRRQILVDEAHNAAWKHIFKWYDVGGLIRCVSWIVDSDANPVGKQRIDDVRVWIDAIMGLYLLNYKPTILATGTCEIDYTPTGPAPWTFTEVLAACNTPWFTAHPEDQTVAAGATATFTVEDNGYDGRTLKWQVSDDDGETWQDIPGETAASYTTAQTVAEDTGKKFRCVCTYIQFIATSNVATLTVT